MRILSNLIVSGTLDIDTVTNAGTNTNRFLVQDTNGVVRYRTGAEVASDIGAVAGYVSTIKHQVKLGENISKGQAVYVSSANGTNMIVSKASNTTEGTSSKTLGLLETGGVTNDLVNVITEGLLAGLDTSTAVAGDPVWLGISGNLIFGLANKPYAPSHLVFIGIVTRVQQNNGEIFVKVQNGFELQEIHNVQITSTPNDNDVLTYELSSGLYKMKSIGTICGYVPMQNPMTTLGDMIYGLASGVPARVGGNTTTAKQFLSQTGTGTASAAPAWSAIAGSDVTGAALTKTDDTNVTLTLGGSASTSLLRAASLTLGWTGTLATTRGGTGLSSYTLGDTIYASAANTLAKLAGNTTTTKKFLAQTGDGTNSAAPTWATISSSDLPALPNAVTFNNSGSGAASGTTFDGSVARTISYNTIGAQPLATNLTSLAGLTYGTSLAFVKMSAAGTFSLDTNTYLTGNQTITLSGDVSGSGATAITTTLATVTQSTGSNFVKITLDTKGRVTGNTAVAASDLNSTFGSQTANYVYAAPNGVAGNPAFRALVSADIPSLSGLYLPLTGGTLTGALSGTSATFSSSVTAVGLYGYYLKGRASDNYGAFWFGSNDGATRYGFIQSHSTNSGQLYIKSDGGGGITLDSNGTTITGALSGTSATFSTEVTSSGSQGRFGGWATGAGYQGNALEVGVSGGSAVVIGYNRTTSVYIPLTIGGNTNLTTTIGGNTIVLQNNGVTALTIASTGAATFSSSVGIGVTPTYKLDVSVTTNDGIRSTSSAGQQSYLGNTGGEAVVGTLNNYGFGIITNGSIRQYITSGGNLGLGVTPSAWSLGKALDISGGVGILSYNNGSYYTNNAYYNGGWIYKASSYASYYFQPNNGEHQWYNAPSGTAGNAISFTQAMTLDASGRLVIGDTSTTYKLDVNGTTNLRGALSGTSATFGGNINITGAGSYYYGVGLSNTTARLGEWDLANQAILSTNYTAADGQDDATKPSWGVVLNSGAGDYFKVARKAAGAAGTLSALLTIASTGAATFSSSVTAGSTFGINSSYIANADATTGRLLFGDGNSANAALRMVTNSATVFYLDAVKWGSSASEVILSLQTNGGITHFGGSVGIGTSSPNAKLEVYGSGTLNTTWQQWIYNGTQALRLGVSSSGADIQSTGSVPLYLNYGGNNTIINATAGNVGIGTSTFQNAVNFQMSAGSGASATPAMGLFNNASSPTTSASTTFNLGFINGTADYVPTGIIYGSLTWLGQGNDAGYGAGSIQVINTSGGNAGRSSHSADMVFNTKPSGNTGVVERMRISSTGAATFSSSVTTTQLITQSSSGTAALFLKDGSANNKWEIGHITNNLYFYNYTKNSNDLIINGSTGAATFSSSVTTGGDIMMNVNATTETIWNGGYGGAVQLLRSDVNTTRWARIGIVNDTKTWIGGIHIDTNANVGIGTSSPTLGKLQVEGSGGDILISVNNTTTNATGLYLTVYTSGSLVSSGKILQDNSGNMRFSTGTSSDTERMRITSGGNVGIGSTTINDKLDVYGNIRASVNTNYYSVFTYSGGTSIQMYSPSAETSDSMTFVINGASSSTTGNAFIFKTQTGNTTPSAVLTISKTGATIFTSSVTATGFFETSDLRIKNIIERNPSVSLDIDLVKYQKKDSSGVRYGYIAQEVKELIPELASGDDILSLNYQDIHSVLLHQQKYRIELLEKEIKELKAKLAN